MRKSTFLFLFIGAVLALVVSMEFAAREGDTWTSWLIGALLLFLMTRIIGWQRD